MENQGAIITTAINAAHKVLQGELNVAKRTWNNDKDALKNAENELKEDLFPRIKTIEEVKEDLLQKKESFEQISLAGNFASELAKGISADDIATSITAAAKSISQALNSIENAHVETKAMEVRVNNVDVVDVKKTKDLVKNYADSTQKALRYAEDCKQAALKIAVNYSRDIKSDLDIKIGEIATLPAKIQTLGKDIDAIVKEQQEALNEANNARDKKQLEVIGLQLDEIKSGLAVKNLESVINLKKPEPLSETAN